MHVADGAPETDDLRVQRPIARESLDRSYSARRSCLLIAHRCGSAPYPVFEVLSRPQHCPVVSEPGPVVSEPGIRRKMLVLKVKLYPSVSRELSRCLNLWSWVTRYAHMNPPWLWTGFCPGTGDDEPGRATLDVCPSSRGRLTWPTGRLSGRHGDATRSAFGSWRRSAAGCWE
jgi:hypothetical protein